jgi:hypothetical protein
LGNSHLDLPQVNRQGLYHQYFDSNPQHNHTI